MKLNHGDRVEVLVSDGNWYEAIVVSTIPMLGSDETGAVTLRYEGESETFLVTINKVRIIGQQ